MSEISFSEVGTGGSSPGASPSGKTESFSRGEVTECDAPNRNGEGSGKMSEELAKDLDRTYESYRNENSRDCGLENGVDKSLSDAEHPQDQLRCRNEHLEGGEHPVTGVPFVRREVEVDGQHREVVVPKFESSYDAQLPEAMYKASDRVQFQECNAQLKEEMEANPGLKEQFDEEQLEQIENGDTPDGYTWHHDADAGKMQLVETEIHQKTGHTGGRLIWGGGTDSR